MNTKHNLWLVVLLFTIKCSLAQTYYNLQVVVIDSLSKMPLEAASVSITKHKHLHITNPKGVAYFDSLPEGNHLVHIYFVGYHHADLFVKIPQQQKIKIELCPEDYHLHESVISSTTSGLNIGFNKTILGITDIFKTNAQNLAELSSKIAGVTQLSSAGNISKPVIRGLHGQRIVIVNGNNRLEGQQWGEDHAPEVDNTNINELEIIKGAAGVEFGSDAIGGVIKLKPKPFLVDNGIKTNVGFAANSNNKLGRTNFTVRTKNGNKNSIAYDLGGSLAKAGDSKSANYQLSNTGFTEQNLNLATKINVNKLSIESGITTYNSKQAILAGAHVGNIDDLNRALFAEKPLVILPFTYNIKRPFMQVSHQTFNTALNYNLSKNSSLHYNFTRQVNNRQEFDSERPYNPILRDLPAVDLEVLSTDNTLTYSNKLTYHTNFKAGINTQQQQNTVRGTQYVIPPYTATTLGCFVFLEKVILNTKIGTGLRYDYKTLSVPQNYRTNNFNNPNRSFANPTFAITLNHQFKDNLVLISSISNGWRAPSVNELFSNGLHYGIANYEIGNSNLQTERAFNFDISLKKNLNHWYLGVNVFNQYFSNFIYRLPLPEPTLTIRGAFPTFKFNQTKANLAGIELELNYKPEYGLYIENTVSYLHANDLTQNTPLIFMPANRINSAIGFALKNTNHFRNTYLEMQSLYVGKQHRFPQNIDFVNPPNAYLLIGTAIGSTIKNIKKLPDFNMSLNIKNILNTSYRDYLSRYRYFADDTGLNITLNIQFNF